MTTASLIPTGGRFHLTPTFSPQEDDTKEMFSLLETRAAAVLRNLAHHDEQHQLLLQSGAVDVLADIMNRSQVRSH